MCTEAWLRILHIMVWAEDHDERYMEATHAKATAVQCIPWIAVHFILGMLHEFREVEKLELFPK